MSGQGDVATEKLRVIGTELRWASSQFNELYKQMENLDTGLCAIALQSDATNREVSPPNRR
ncbi:unnamed protein product [Protopolystoma xenopodis]|uniref:Uncharacterized protein n=1 Tax=Protopolystoma xenopodis TaxID=117903 RepID=A0A448XK18_9PLAT|nr:unnamed protein product [Protopolystoma xenopodis]